MEKKLKLFKLVETTMRDLKKNDRFILLDGKGDRVNLSQVYGTKSFKNLLRDS